MSIKILMPALSPTMTEGSLAKWHVKVGDEVNPGDVIAEIETDKATMEVEAVDQGVIGQILVSEGTEAVPVNETIGMLIEEGEEESCIVDRGTDKAAAAAPLLETASRVVDVPSDSSAPALTASLNSTPLARRIAEQAGVDLLSVEGSGINGKIVRADVEAVILSDQSLPKPQVAKSNNVPSPKTNGANGNRVFASPLARRLAAQSNIDIAVVRGSGPNGRVIKTDIDEFIRNREPQKSVIQEVEVETGSRSKMLVDTSATVKLSTMRQVIAKRMIESKTEVPHFYLTMDCEIDELLRVRSSLNDAQSDVRVSVNDFVIRACGMGLMKVPAANVAYKNENEMLQFQTADISVAVALEGGLITPIVRAVENKGFKQISSEMRDLASRAREGKLMPEEYQGGSFSISNLGMFGVKQFDAVINTPQACILAVGVGEQRPVVKDGQIVPATVMSCTLSVDHRVVDGAIGAELLASIKRYLEEPALMLL
ncbi:MAG: 2-oxo acid dehydrogenase subunit E2 [Pseudomonadota bacterium]|nr:2-oxo acid dehydrogenase subunit E2 [Pseudomonadota bacterium]MEC8724887.1 2-oxo acid dehydrogenase subunit E2 [Pseudomonadota bacterium]